MTRLKGPYDDHPRDDVKRLQTAVPQEIADDLLIRMFPQHGFQDRCLAILVNTFYEECLAEGIPLSYDPENETRAIEILTRIKSCLKKTP